jgi:hypothetical protein
LDQNQLFLYLIKKTNNLADALPTSGMDGVLAPFSPASTSLRPFDEHPALQGSGFQTLTPYQSLTPIQQQMLSYVLNPTPAKHTTFLNLTLPVRYYQNPLLPPSSSRDRFRLVSV